MTKSRPKGVRNKFGEVLKQTILDGIHNSNSDGLFGQGDRVKEVRDKREKC